jgi:hypothetical protein
MHALFVPIFIFNLTVISTLGVMLNPKLLSTLFENIKEVLTFNAHINYFNILLVSYRLQVLC